MFAVTSLWICWTLLSVSLVGFTCARHKNVTAQSGQDVTLTCGAPNKNIIVVEWSRTDLKEDYVLLYRDEQFVPDNQHPSYKDRVDLQDRQMKDGDTSLILKNVTSADNGTYECRVFMRGVNRRKRALLKTRPISIIYLSVVDPPGQTGGDTEDGGKEDGGKKEAVVGRGHFWLVASSLLLLGLIVALVIASKLPKKNLSNHPPSDEPADI